MQSEFDMTLRMKYDSLEILNTNFPDETGIEERLEQALQKLPERCRSIFVMNKLEGKKQQNLTSRAGSNSKKMIKAYEESMK